jgi:hypothetical protein
MRDCCKVISEIIEKIPLDKTELKDNLIWDYEYASYKTPEDSSQWNRLELTLSKHIPNPSEDWEFQILSIFTGHPIGSEHMAIKRD